MKHMIDGHLWKEIITPDIFSGDVMFGEPMKKHTSLRIGGFADIFACPLDAVFLKNMLVALKNRGIPFVPVGGGTNLLVRDGGIDGVVVSLRNFTRMVVVKEEGDGIVLFAESGLPLQKLVGFARDSGYSGIEGLAGIPGSFGGAVAGNAGAFDYSVQDVLVSATVMLPDGRIDKIDADKLGFGYRKSNIPEGAIILSGHIKMKKGDKKDISKKVEDFIKEKSLRQPLSERSAGCVFKNPKNISAGALIDKAGCKGMRIGDVEVSRVHANFFVNKGNASAADFMELMDEVGKKVMTTSGIGLEPEIRVIGRE